MLTGIVFSQAKQKEGRPW